MYNAYIYLDVHASIDMNMCAHGHLISIQMATWVMDGVDQHRGQLVRQGFAITWPRAPVHCRWMGGPAASGVRRAIFTCQDKRAAEVGYQVTHAGWAFVPDHIDERGWRGVDRYWEFGEA